MTDTAAPVPDHRLQIEALSARYAGPDVVRRISLTVGRGRVLGLLGPNGAGKTSLLKAVCGLIVQTGGTVRLDGQVVSGLPAHRIIRKGVAHVPQGRNLFPYMTGVENLRVGGHTRRDRDALDDDIERFVEASPVVQRIANRRALLMSGGEQQIIAIGRAMMSRPRVLLLDEPSLGLAPVLITWVFEAIQTLIDQVSEEGVAVVLVEQNVRKALEVSDDIAVMVGGSIAYEGSADSLDSDAVLDLYMGRGSAAADDLPTKGGRG